MIFVTGDTHADFSHRFNTENFPEQKEMTKDDYVIICGDFGGIFAVGWENRQEKHWLDWFESRNYTLLFVDGNHENFDRLNGYPVKEWHGGKVHEIRPHVLHLMRGQIFEINGKKIFAFGGASSHDVSGGILDTEDPDFKKKKKALDKDWEPYRIDHLTWWKQELATDEEMEEGEKNLKAHNYKVDYIITHCCASDTQTLLGGNLFIPDRQTDFFAYFVKEYVSYDKWFFGHYHGDEEINDKEILVYEKMIRVI